MKKWLEKIKHNAEKLQGPGGSRKETKLQLLIKKILLVEGRINAGNLAS